MTKNKISLGIYHTIGLALLFPLWKSGWLEKIWVGDSTKLSVVIFGLLLFNVILTLLDKWHDVDMFRGMLVFLGLVGTVLGISIASFGIDAARLDDVNYVKEMGALLFSGVGTSLYTTLVGSVGYIWLTISLHYWGKEEVGGEEV